MDATGLGVHGTPLADAWAPTMHTLTTLVGGTQPSPPAVLVHAPNSPASAADLVRTRLVSSEACRVAQVSPLTACTPRLLFAQTLRQFGAPAACADLGAYLQALQQCAQHARLLLVLHDAERMRDLWPESLWEILPHLAELAHLQGRLSVVYVSTLPWSAFRDVAGRAVSAAPIALYLGRLRRDEALALVHSDVDACLDAFHRMQPATPLPPRPALRTLHQHVAALLYDSVKSVVRDEHELRVLTAAVWHALLGAVPEQGAHLAKLMPSLSELIRDALHRLVPRTVGLAQWVREKTTQHASNAPPTPPAWPGRTGFSGMAAFLLIAAFLASYNPAKTDVRYFVRELGNSRKRKRRGKSQNAAEAALHEVEGEREVWNRPQFWGPRTFPLERLLAIYHALLADFEQDLNEDALLAANDRAARAHDKLQLHLEHVAGEFWSRSATALAQINQLVAEKLLVRMSPAGKLGTMQYRVNVSYTHIRALAHAVGFPLDVWLWDRYT